MLVSSRIGLFVPLGFSALSAPSFADLVTNGDFGTGNFSGWTLGGDSSSDYVTQGAIPNSTDQAALGTTTGTGTLSQSLATDSGQEYLLQFVVSADGSVPNSFSASLGGDTLLSVIVPPFPTSYTFDYLATAPMGVLQFSDVDQSGFIYLTRAFRSQYRSPRWASPRGWSWSDRGADADRFQRSATTTNRPNKPNAPDYLFCT